MRGEFIRADGLVIPNNITTYGVRTILAAALRNEVPTFFVGLVDAAPDPDLLIAECIEPTLGVNNYHRQPILRSLGGWPTEGNVNGEPYFESEWQTFEAIGGSFDTSVRRLMLVQKSGEPEADVPTDADLKVLALSSALPDDLVITPATLEANRKFKYRIYAR